MLHPFTILIYIPQIQVEQAAIDHVRQEFAPPDNPVFQLVPPEFGEYAGILFESMGSPDINSENIWEIYRELVYRFEHLDDAVDFIEQLHVYLDLLDDEGNVADMEPPAGMELHGGMENPGPDGSYYMGGVNNGLGLGMSPLGSLVKYY